MNIYGFFPRSGFLPVKYSTEDSLQSWLPLTTYLRLCLSQNTFIYPSVLEDHFASIVFLIHSCLLSGLKRVHSIFFWLYGPFLPLFFSSITYPSIRPSVHLSIYPIDMWLSGGLSAQAGWVMRVPAQPPHPATEIPTLLITCKSWDKDTKAAPGPGPLGLLSLLLITK